MGSRVFNVEDAQVEVVDLTIRAILVSEVATRNYPAEQIWNPALDLPPEHLLVKLGRGLYVVGWKVDKDESVWRCQRGSPPGHLVRRAVPAAALILKVQITR